MNNIHIRYLLVIVLASVFSFQILADDTGITKVRLLQLSDTSYILETDVPQVLLTAIKPPVFPERFDLGKFEYTNQSGWITLKLQITSSGEGLMPEEEILLPWDRNGVDFTAQWLDGSAFKGLFNRSLNGIYIPLNQVMEVQKSTSEVITEGFIIGFQHFGFRFVHILFILVLVWYNSSLYVLRLLLWFSFGQAVSMVLMEIRMPAFDLLLTEWLVLAFIFSLTLAIAYKKPVGYSWIALLVLGTIHGLSYSYELQSESLLHIQKVQSVFAFNIATDLCHYSSALVLLLIVPKLKIVISNKKYILACYGIITVFLILLVYDENIQTGKTEILELPSLKTKTIQQTAPAPSGKKVIRRTTATMTTPVMVYLTVESYQVKQEILINAASALEAIDQHVSYQIPVDMQEVIKSNINKLILAKSTILINNVEVSPVSGSVNFVRLSRGGVYIRETTRKENIEEGIIGISNIYDISTYPDSISINWNFFPGTVENIETTVVDPHGVFTTHINPDNSLISWVNRLPGYKPAKVEPVRYERYRLPIASMILWISVVAMLIYLARSKKTILKKRIILGLLFMGFIAYPFIRFPSPIESIRKPSVERTRVILHDLLSNVYRAFERQDENAVYDRLALSVAGQQLTQIYLENRQALALENRGGAKANVDEVKILDIFDINRTDENLFDADVLWTVSGSVSHFGHTHYRKNQYRARVTFSSEDQIWKIINIDTIDEKRIL